MKIALISDIHEDLISLQHALHKIERLACDEIICLGDISGFSASHHSYFESRNARECLRLVKEHCQIIIPGNHDLHAAKRIPGNSIFTFPENWYDLDFYERQNVSNNSVWLYEQDELNPLYAKSDIAFLNTLPEFETKNITNKTVLLTHYIFPNVNGADRFFVTKNTDFEAHRSFMKKHGCLFSFSGHQHHPGLIIAEEKLVEKKFGRVCTLHENAVVLVPAITSSQKANGFCIFDTNDLTVKAIRI